MQFRSKQCGGTVLGLLLGLAIGVGVAVVIAFWFGKQSPVVNRMQPKGSLSEVEETDKNKTWDPNGGLFGKAVPPSLQTIATNAAMAASAALGEGGSAESTERAVAPKPAKPVGSAAEPAKPKPTASSSMGSSDPIGEMLKARAKAKAASAAAATATPSTTGMTGSTSANAKPVPKAEPHVIGSGSGNEGGVYFVQVGAFKTPEDAQAQKVKLALLGVETKITEREQSGKTVYRVRAGVFKKLDDAEAMKSKLDKAGFDAVLVKAPI